MSEKPKCKDCKFIENVPGNTHKACSNENANVAGTTLGITKGWFDWPYNFDPVWLISCDGFEQRSC